MSKSNRRFLVQYILILFLLLLLFLFVYSAVEKMYRQDIREDCLNSIQQGCQQLRTEVQRLNYFSASLRENSDFHEVCHKAPPYSSKDLYAIKKLQTEIHDTMAFYTVSSNLLLDMGVLLPNDICLTRDYCFPDVREYYPIFLKYGDVSLETWENLVRGGENNLRFLPAVPCWNYGNKQYSVIQLSCAVNNPVYTASGHVFFQLDAQEFISILVPASVLETGAVQVYDRKNDTQLISSGNWAQSASEIVQYEDPLNGITFRVMISGRMISQKTAAMRSIFYFGFAAYLVIGLVLSLLFSRRNAKPIESLVNMIREGEGEPEDKKQSDYQYIENSFRRIGIDLSRAEALIAQQAGNVRSAVIERLINGLIYTQEEWDEARRELPDFPEKYCVLYVMVLSDESEMDAKRTLCQRQLLSSFGEKLIVHFTERQLILAILPLNESRPVPESYRKPLRDFMDIMQGWHAVSVLMAVSAAFDSMALLHEACRQARHYFRFPNHFEDRILFHDAMQALSVNEPSLDYIDDQRFYMLIHHGEKELCRQQIQYVRENINACAFVDDSFLHLTFDSFRQIFSRLHYDLHARGLTPPALPAYSQKMNVEQLFEEILAHADALCGLWAEAARQDESAIEHAILDYISRNIFDPGLCIQQVLDQYGISERTLQRYMHTTVQKSFFEYISDIRLERARTLVLQTSMPLQSIAEKCGFSLTNTFYKAYSRRWGVSPGNDRKNNGALPEEEE